MASVIEFPRGQRAEPCPSPRADALLIEQLARATRELRVREAERQPSDVVRAVIKSLRNTLARMAQLGTVFRPDPRDFVVRRDPGGEVELWHRGRRLSISPEPLREAFEAAAVEVEPGQVLLADRELVRRVAQESLLGYTLRELRLREAKADLFRALEDLGAGSVRQS